MYLFIDTISDKSTLILFNDKKLITKKELIIKWREYDNFLNELLNFLEENNLIIDNIDWIVFVNWPWWFTWTRIVTLTLNSILFAKKIKLCSIDYFELMRLSSLDFPMLIKANRWEYLIKIQKDDNPYLTEIANIPDWDYSWIWDIIDFANKNISIKWEIDYEKVISSQSFVFLNNRAEPYYIKKPSIS